VCKYLPAGNGEASQLDQDEEQEHEGDDKPAGKLK
jgi:hypothetical protein